MRPRRRDLTLGACLLAAAGALAGCEPARRGPQLASSSNHVTYAARFADALHATRTALLDAERESTRIVGETKSYPDALKDPSWSHVAVVVRRADEAGRSEDWVRAQEEARAVARFFDEEKQPLGRKVGGAAQFVAKQKGCTADVQTPAAHALDKAVEESLRQRLRESSPAQDGIDSYEDALGKDNVETLRRQADDVALSSYLTHVAAPRAANDLVRMLDEVESVRRTLEAEIEDAKSAHESAGDDARKKAARTRQSRAIEAKGRIEGQVAPAAALAEEAEERAARAKDAHDAAIRDLLAVVEGKAKSAAK